MASSFGLELLFQSTLSSINKKTDVLVVLVHWKLISNGYLCLGLDSETSQTEEPSELLPSNWSSSNDVYQLKYMKNGSRYLLKCIVVEQQLLINLVRIQDGEASTLTLDRDVQVQEDFKNYKEAFKNRANLITLVEKDLINPLIEKKKTSALREQQPRPERERTPPAASFEDPSFSRIHPRTDQFFPEIGRGDLDPFGRGGGMLMDPRHPRPSYLPPGGQIPPGARFDPFGPEPPQQFPQFPRQGTPRPRLPFGEPNPDHLPPPGSDDMFM